MSANYHITRIPAFTDNYLWLIDNEQSAIVIDPGDAQPILDTLEEKGLPLAAIYLTHHHADHTGGVDQLVKAFACPVFGPQSRHIPSVTQHVADCDTIKLLDIPTKVLAVPGHTLDHIAYFIEQPAYFGAPVLFCGDTLFAGGCGRLFEGSAAQMHQSLLRLKNLPKQTKIYCAHEYTQANLAFALSIEPENQALIQRFDEVKQLREQQQATVPSNLALECETNPFLRVDQPAIVSQVQQAQKKIALNDDEVFACIRKWKDNFS